MINEKGGINGRKINFVTYDDAYSPPKTVEQARKLVESDNVLLIFASLGTPPNSAIHKYMNQQKVPHLFLATGATKWNDPKNFPWTMGWQPSYQAEGKIYAKYLLDKNPAAKVAILYQNDDYGKDYLKGFMDGLGDKIKPVITLTYEVSDPTIDSQMTRMQAAGADTFMNITTPKFAAMAIKKAAELNWKPMHFLNNVSASVGAVIKPAGYENAQGILSTAYMKDPTDPQWKNDAGFKTWEAFIDKYMPGANKADGGLVTAYNDAQTLVTVLQMCGDNLTRENIMKQAASLKGVQQENDAAWRSDPDIGRRLRARPAGTADEVRQGSLGIVRARLRRPAEVDELGMDLGGRLAALFSIKTKTGGRRTRRQAGFETEGMVFWKRPRVWPP